MNISKEINYCNKKGDICIGKFKFKENNLEEFLSRIYDYKLELENNSNLEIEINSLILYFKDFDFDKLNKLYKESKKNKNTNITNIILEYLVNYSQFENELFCSADECKAIIKASKLIIFRNQESIVLKTLETSKREIIIDDYIAYKNKLLEIEYV